MQMQTDEYLAQLFIKHGSEGHSRAGEGDSLSASAEHAAGQGQGGRRVGYRQFIVK